MILIAQLNRASDGELCGDSRKSAVFVRSDFPEAELGLDKDFVRRCVENKPTMCDFRAVKLLVRQIWASDDAGGFMGISFANGVLS